jgi:hypothetical protein
VVYGAFGVLLGHVVSEYAKHRAVQCIAVVLCHIRGSVRAIGDWRVRNEGILDRGRPPAGWVSFVCTASIARERIAEAVITRGGPFLTPTAFDPRSLNKAACRDSWAFIH